MTSNKPDHETLERMFSILSRDEYLLLDPPPATAAGSLSEETDVH